MSLHPLAPIPAAAVTHIHAYTDLSTKGWGIEGALEYHPDSPLTAAALYCSWLQKCFLWNGQPADYKIAAIALATWLCGRQHKGAKCRLPCHWHIQVPDRAASGSSGWLDYVPSQVHEIAHGIELWHMSHCEGVRACWLRVNDAAA